MSKRYYISPIVGTGDEFDPFRPKVADYGVPWAGSIPSDPKTGHPTSEWALVVVNAKNHSALLADGAIDALPDFPLDGKVSSVHTVTKNAMINKMKKRGIKTSFIAGTDGYREVIRGVGRLLDEQFDENNFDVAE